jgi:hypothetical protein
MAAKKPTKSGKSSKGKSTKTKIKNPRYGTLADWRSTEKKTTKKTTKKGSKGRLRDSSK